MAFEACVQTMAREVIQPGQDLIIGYNYQAIRQAMPGAMDVMPKSSIWNKPFNQSVEFEYKLKIYGKSIRKIRK